MFRLALVSIALVSLNGCATYNTTSAVSFVTTGKSIGDHGASLITDADCNLLKHLWSGEYICEVKPIYNQNPL